MKDKRDKETGDMFDDAGESTVGMVQADAPGTSIKAALALCPHLKKLRLLVWECFIQYGDMTDMELEVVPELRHLAQTTASKRRTELYQAGFLKIVGQRRNQNGHMAIVWGLSPETADPEKLPGKPKAPAPVTGNEEWLEQVAAGTLSVEDYGRRCYTRGHRAGYAEGRRQRIRYAGLDA